MKQTPEELRQVLKELAENIYAQLTERIQFQDMPEGLLPLIELPHGWNAVLIHDFTLTAKGINKNVSN